MSVIAVFLRAFPGYPVDHAPLWAGWLVDERIVAGRVPQGVPVFVVTLLLVLPLTIAFARLFASVFERPFLRHRAASGPPRLRLRRAREVPA